MSGANGPSSFLEPGKEAYLVRQIGRANVVLFVGAGFSALARNRLGESIPTGGGLTRLLWSFLEYPQPFDETTSLGEVYEAALTSGIPHSRLRNLLEQHLLCTDIPAIYAEIVRPFWNRIYTTNVDDLVERIYLKASEPKLEVLAYPADDITERDQALVTLQAIHLNGRLPCDPTHLTFSPIQYAKAGLRSQPLYDQFVRDYSTHPTLFIGTKLDEPLFLQYLMAREDRDPRTSEQRPESFLVAASISPPKRATLRKLNITPIEADTETVLRWLAAKNPGLPSRLEMLKVTNPGLAAVLEIGATGTTSGRDLREFGLAFSPVPPVEVHSTDRSQYLLGAAPRWEDLFDGLDAPRRITEQIIQWVEKAIGLPTDLAVGALLGSAGSGKSTILRRLGIRLAEGGRTVYLTNSESLPAPEVLRRVADTVPARMVLLFDNAEVAITQLGDIIRACQGALRPPIVLIASRTNDFDRLTGRLPEGSEIRQFHVPLLDRGEIDSILLVLEQQGLLGVLNGKSPSQRVAAFEERAKKQILVAMKEATSGDGFDKIIADEFDRLTPIETKSLYLCTALATDAGYRITKGEFVGCSRVAPAEALHLLSRNLRDIVLPTGPTNDLLLLRHRVIAENVIEKVAPRPLLRDAYIRLLHTLAPSLERSGSRSRVCGLYRAIANHMRIYTRFREDIAEARSIFSSLVPVLSNNAQFWLQFGSLELEGKGGDLGFAENYLRQAESLNPADNWVHNAIGHLLIRKAREATDLSAALELRRQGSEILETRITLSKYTDAYALHIYCSQRYQWSRVWLVNNDAEKREELEHLLRELTTGCEANPFHKKLARLRDMVRLALLQMVIPADKRPADPPLPH
jgi:hypothetical protein